MGLCNLATWASRKTTQGENEMQTMTVNDIFTKEEIKEMVNAQKILDRLSQKACGVNEFKIAKQVRNGETFSIAITFDDPDIDAMITES